MFFVSAIAQETAVSLHEKVGEVIYSDPELALEYATKELELAGEDNIMKVDALNDIGQALYYMDQYEEAIGNLNNSLEISRTAKYESGEAKALFNLGDMYILMGKYSQAIDHLSNGLQIFEKVKDEEGIADCLNSLGLINSNQGNYEQALDYFNRALEHGNDVSKGDSYTYMAEMYLEMEAYRDAQLYANMALEAGKKNEDNYVVSSSLDVIGHVYSIEEDYQKAIKSFAEALKIKMELEDSQGMAETMIELALNYKAMGVLDSTNIYMQRAFNLATEIGAGEETRSASLEMAKLKAGEGMYDSAFYYQKKFIEINERIMNEQASKKIAEMEADIAARKQEEEINLMKKEKEFQQKMFTLYIIGGLVIFLFLTGFVIVTMKRYREKKKANAVLEEKNNIIEEQKEHLEEKNNEIIDSINYAKRIQDAILPPDSLFSQAVPGSFILYKPKDIVAGDFYWLEMSLPASTESDSIDILFAAADCTGHGVPGAMVSVVCHNALNRAVREFALRNTGKILDKTRELVVETFEKSEAEVKDGMDISICNMKIGDNETMLQWSGANNPLWIIRKDSTEIEEIKADKQPIGKFTDERPFTSHDITLRKGDAFYIFTDGYADQFGGPKGKKFKYKPFKELLVAIQNKSMEEQCSMLDREFEAWRGEMEQVDDVCIIGVRI